LHPKLQQNHNKSKALCDMRHQASLFFSFLSPCLLLFFSEKTVDFYKTRGKKTAKRTIKKQYIVIISQKNQLVNVQTLPTSKKYLVFCAILRQS